MAPRGYPELLVKVHSLGQPGVDHTSKVTKKKERKEDDQLLCVCGLPDHPSRNCVLLW